jgi:alpha-glucuronidase
MTFGISSGLRPSRIFPLLLLWLATAVWCVAEDGYRLWLRYDKVESPQQLAVYRKAVSALVVEGDSPSERVIRAELRQGLAGLLGTNIPLSTRVEEAGLVAGTPRTSGLIRDLKWDSDLKAAGTEGYVIRSATLKGRRVTVIASQGPPGALYGAFHFLRLIATGKPISDLDIVERPLISLRLLNHWDNLDGTIERGYAGNSLWKWSELPDRLDPRLKDYARANASIGINGAVLNNVNANPQSLTSAYLKKASAIAAVFRPYGIRVYLSANFAAPKALGGLPTADPLDPAVARWWKAKADQIYRLIPDFGGFLVKANSEGQPGPQDYGRTHADGANVLADALAPHGGIVMWRAFVYVETVDPDRVKRAYAEFVPLDGKFRGNVFVQAKNGPLDFQPREPFHPLFGAMPRTPLMAELQITQEYLGHSTHLVYLAPMWKEFLDADTYAKGPGSLVAKVVDGTLDGRRSTAIAGVANTGDDRNWCGHDFAQANWYAYGRLAWNHRLTSEAIADEWIRMTWSHDPDVIAQIRSIMLDSREALVDYSMPLGLHHLIGGNHYAPMPENSEAPRADWTATYYHQADAGGIGFDRTRSGSDAVDQYHPPLNDLFNDVQTCPEEFLLWFHHLPWTYRTRSGLTLWQEIGYRYTRGVNRARGMQGRWLALAGRVDDERHRAVAQKLSQQVADAAQWREKCMSYFRQFSKMPAAALRLSDDGGWCWFEHPRVIEHNDKIIVGSVANGSTDASRRGDIEVITHDLKTSSTTRALLRAQLEADDHDSPALLARPDGRILAVYAKHGEENRFYYRVSEKDDPTRWGSEKESAPSPSTRLTYANLFQLPAEGGRIYDFFRGLDNSYKPSYVYSDDMGETWTTGNVIINVPVTVRHRPYVRYASNGRDTIHLLYTEGHPRDFDNSVYHVFYREGWLHDSHGERLARLEEGLARPDAGTPIHRGSPDQVAWICDIALDSQGRPYVAYSVQIGSAGLPPTQGGDDLRYRYARWDGEAWQDHALAFAGTRLYAGEDDYTGLAALDPTDPDVIYISTNADPLTGESLISQADKQRHWEIFKGVTTDCGATWEWAPLTINSSADNLRPIVTRAPGRRPSLLWLRGRYHSYTSYEQEVVGLIAGRAVF